HAGAAEHEESVYAIGAQVIEIRRLAPCQVVVNHHPDGKDASQKIETQYPCRCPHGRLCRRAKGRILEQQGRDTSLRAEAAPPRNSQRNASERPLSKALRKKHRCKKEKPPRVGLTGL